MKIESITVQNFKRFDNLEVSFKNKTLQEVTNRFLILGDNGTGKTTLLQAIALPLALATKKIQTVSEFDWVGFLPGRFWIGGSPHIELEISFEDEELEATRSVARRWYDTQPVEFRPHNFVEPGDSHIIKLTLSGEYWKVGDENKLEERSQFQGRYYAQRLLRSDPSARSEFSRLPGIFWFDQFRNLGSNPLPESSGDGQIDHASGIPFDLGVGRLRQYLIEWDQRRRSPQNNTSNDYLSQLQTLYTKVFPERSFNGVEYQPSNDSPTEMNTYFTLYDGHRTYDIVEISAGEQAVFPMLYEIVRQQISYSVVLVDEIDLNLHPPAAQLLVNQLPKLLPTCQFIFTTHSEAVNDVIAEEETYRILGGFSVSVNILYCEGGKNSPDIRVLLNILSGICTVRPAGNKYGLDRQILFIKQENLLPSSVCRIGITEVIRQYEQAQIIREDDVLNSFDQLLPVCRVGGVRLQNFLMFFSGKDLLCGMRAALTGWGLGEPFVFRERIVKGIENSTENGSSWIAEWSQLRQAVQNFSP